MISRSVKLAPPRANFYKIETGFVCPRLSNQNFRLCTPQKTVMTMIRNKILQVALYQLPSSLCKQYFFNTFSLNVIGVQTYKNLLPPSYNFVVSSDFKIKML